MRVFARLRRCKASSAQHQHQHLDAVPFTQHTNTETHTTRPPLSLCGSEVLGNLCSAVLCVSSFHGTNDRPLATRLRLDSQTHADPPAPTTIVRSSLG